MVIRDKNTPYGKVYEELSIFDGLLAKGDRIVISQIW